MTGERESTHRRQVRIPGGSRMLWKGESRKCLDYEIELDPNAFCQVPHSIAVRIFVVLFWGHI